MKKSKKNYLIIVLIVILLALAIGYSAFAANLKITGTASGSATWEVVFDSTSVTTSDSTKATAVVSTTDKTKMTVDANLTYPGDGVTITAVIKNNGSIDAKLTGYKLNDTAVNAGSTVQLGSTDLYVTVPAITANEQLKAGKTCTVVFVIKWDKDSTATTIDDQTFYITFDYEQDTTEFNTNASHTHGS